MSDELEPVGRVAAIQIRRCLRLARIGANGFTLPIRTPCFCVSNPWMEYAELGGRGFSRKEAHIGGLAICCVTFDKFPISDALHRRPSQLFCFIIFCGFLSFLTHLS